MCNFSQGVWEKGMEAGRKEGAAQNMLNSIKNLLKNTGWPERRHGGRHKRRRSAEYARLH